MLQWARANGCAWDELTRFTAAYNGEPCPWNARACERAARHGDHLAVAQWVRDNS